MSERVTDAELDEILADCKRQAHILGENFWPVRLIAELRDLRQEVYTLRPTVEKLLVERKAAEDALEETGWREIALRQLLKRIHAAGPPSGDHGFGPACVWCGHTAEHDDAHADDCFWRAIVDAVRA
jgi:hypothetical protein